MLVTIMGNFITIDLFMFNTEYWCAYYHLTNYHHIVCSSQM